MSQRAQSTCTLAQRAAAILIGFTRPASHLLVLVSRAKTQKQKKNAISCGVLSFSFPLCSWLVPQPGALPAVLASRKTATVCERLSMVQPVNGLLRIINPMNQYPPCGEVGVASPCGGLARPWSWATHCRGLRLARQSTGDAPHSHPMYVPMTQPPAFLNGS